jgi:hypothetical protein
VDQVEQDEFEPGQRWYRFMAQRRSKKASSSPSLSLGKRAQGLDDEEERAPGLDNEEEEGAAPCGDRSRGRRTRR